ncbi:MAG: response regulator [Deltaproteobacteria bacterium]|nr:response regulator [Deltaproteobacteria bacterium]
MTDTESANNDQCLGLELELRRLRREYKKINRQHSFLQKLMARTKEATASNMNLSMVISAEKTSREIFLDLILQNSTNVILVFDGSGRLLYATNSFIKLLNIPHMGLITGRTLKDLFQNLLAESDMREFEIAFSRAIQGQTTSMLELVVDFDPEESKPRSYNIRINPLIDPDTKTSGTLMLFHDQTELVEASKARASSEAKSAFLAKMSHEIRTPLNSIMGLSKVELQKDLPEQTMDNLAKINAAGGTLLAIINDILDLTKVEIGQFVLYPTPYNFANFVSDTVSLNLVRIANKPIKFVLEIDDDIPAMFFGDELRVKQILSNLLSNAFKYTEMGQVKLSFSCKSDGDNAWLSMTVADTGRGIKPDDLERIFGIYSQADKDEQKAIEGTGLGLSICKDLVELMQGTILVESEFGSGSTFKAFIRQKIIDHTPIGPDMVVNLQSYQFLSRKRIEELPFTRFHMPQVKVLVVDDVETNLDVALALMQPYGFTVDCVTSGLQALAKIKSGTTEYDCIFMDHMMPDMDGLEVVRNIREQIDSDYARNVPIIAMTANALLDSEKLFLKSGFQAYLAKPIDLGKLHVILTNWIRDRLSHVYQVEELPTPMRAGASGGGGSDAGRGPAPPPRGGGTRGAPGEPPPGGRVDQGGRQSDAQFTQRVERPPMSEEEIFERLSTYYIDGLDLVKGLARFENKPSIYLPLLKSFTRHSPLLVDELKNPAEGTLGQYAIKVHGFKGACAGICAHKVAALALAQEMAAKKPDLAAVVEQNDDFVAAAEILIREIVILLRNFPIGQGEETREVMQEPDKKVLASLLAACHAFKNSEIQKALKSLESYEYRSDGDLVEWLREQADNIEYDSIVERLGQYLA